jgi:hypothetical protein
MHLLRINTSNQPKIVINSPEVYLGITRQHAQVGHNNINITKVVIFFTRNPKKWVCIFLIFYDF